MLELRARFDEEANLEWKERLGRRRRKSIDRNSEYENTCENLPDKKKSEEKTVHYGFVSTGNLNESTAKVYADHCLLTCNQRNNGRC